MNSPGGGASKSTEVAAGSSAATDVSLREFVGERVDGLRRELEKDISALRREVEKQAPEYERRLSELNNESGRLQVAVANNVSADTWEAFETQYRLDRERDDARMKAVESFQARLAGALVLATGLTATIVYLLTKLA